MDNKCIQLDSHTVHTYNERCTLVQRLKTTGSNVPSHTKMNDHNIAMWGVRGTQQHTQHFGRSLSS